jgi:hypothetical protein
LRLDKGVIIEGLVMIKNVGRTDKLLRVTAGLLLLGLTAADVIGWWGLIGLVPLTTGLLNWCPAYTLLGIGTCKVQSRDEH